MHNVHPVRLPAREHTMEVYNVPKLVAVRYAVRCTMYFPARMNSDGSCRSADSRTSRSAEYRRFCSMSAMYSEQPPPSEVRAYGRIEWR
jgi:hypothetical protein